MTFTFRSHLRRTGLRVTGRAPRRPREVTGHDPGLSLSPGRPHEHQGTDQGLTRAQSGGARPTVEAMTAVDLAEPSRSLEARLPRLASPALVEHARQRRRSVENLVADRITAFSGSMRFVYLHIAWFASWIGFRVERYPYGLLTMIVSLEAIFLSTFVMISQNRADEKREVIANEQWATVQEEDRQNQELLQLSRQILDLTRAVHAYAATAQQAAGRSPEPS
jgi:uncharacterized membrane protein